MAVYVSWSLEAKTIHFLCNRQNIWLRYKFCWIGSFFMDAVDNGIIYKTDENELKLQKHW